MITARTVLQQGNILQHHITHGYVLSLKSVFIHCEEQTFLSSWSDRQILLCPPCERGGGGDRKCAEDTQWLQCGNDGTLCGCSRGRAEAKWLAPVFAAVSLGDIDDAEEKRWWGVRADHAADVDVTSFTCCCNGVFLPFESSHLSRLNFRRTCTLSRTRR